MDPEEIQAMQQSLDALHALTAEIKESNRNVNTVLFGNEQMGFRGLIDEMKDMRLTLAKMERKMIFYAGALSVVAIITPILLSIILAR